MMILAKSGRNHNRKNNDTKHNKNDNGSNVTQTENLIDRRKYLPDPATPAHVPVSVVPTRTYELVWTEFWILKKHYVSRKNGVFHVGIVRNSHTISSVGHIVEYAAKAVDPLILGPGQTIPRSVSCTRQHHLNVAREPTWIS